MKIIITILTLMISLNAYSQNRSKTHIINQECNLLIISSDSIICTKLDKHRDLLDSIPCYAYYSDVKGIATMYWFDIEKKEAILNELFYGAAIY
jgi:hypothetical protein